MKNSPASRRWLLLALGVVSLLFAGVIYSWSILKAPLAAEFGWTADKLALNYTLSLIFFCLGGLASGLLAARVSSRLRLGCAALLAFLGFFMTSRLTGHLLGLYLSYGCLAALGIGITYNTVISETNAWFPDRSGLSSGALMMGFGFSTLLLGNLCGRLMDLPAFGWRKTFVLLAVGLGAVLLCAACFLRRPNSDERSRLPAAPDRRRTDAFQGLELSSGEMLRRPSFWKLFLFLVLLNAVGVTAISFAKDFAQTLGYAPTMAVTLVGLLAVGNGLGRLTSGGVFDSLGVNAAKYCASFFALLAPALAWLGLRAASPLVGAAGLIRCGVAYGFAPTLSAALVRSFYGARHFPLNFSLSNLGLLPAAFFPTLTGRMIAASGDYAACFLLLLAASTLGLVLNLTLRRP